MHLLGSHLDKLIKADLPILVQVTCSHHVFYNFSHSVPRQRQAGSLEQIIQLIAADVPIAIRICKANGELKVWGDLGHSMKRGESRLDWRGAGRRGSHSGSWPDPMQSQNLTRGLLLLDMGISITSNIQES